MKQVEANPEHSQWYIERFRQMAAAGDDIVGEARLVDAMVDRGSRVLDAVAAPDATRVTCMRWGTALSAWTWTRP
ncbi:hypothetical protein [Kocuria atrinae]|uniref:hypothetical protein n=1 Tax=Kocuria atrinae TaxID=592377 RepID=UPI000318FC6C|nr:hypothetical protein [Kocuria atrinae]